MIDGICHCRRPRPSLESSPTSCHGWWRPLKHLNRDSPPTAASWPTSSNKTPSLRSPFTVATDGSIPATLLPPWTRSCRTTARSWLTADTLCHGLLSVSRSPTPPHLLALARRSIRLVWALARLLVHPLAARRNLPSVYRVTAADKWHWPILPPSSKPQRTVPW